MDSTVGAVGTDDKRISSLKTRSLLWIAYVFSRVLMMTWRIRIVGLEHRRDAVSKNPSGSFILASLHENAIGGVLSHPGQGIACLTSRSKDGEFVAFICKHFGLRSVRGSSSRGGQEARDELIRLLRTGVSVAITVDGPKGPRRIAKAGIVDVARKSGAWVLPITSCAQPHWILRKTWDQTKVPKPFSRLLIRYGEPILIEETVEGDAFKEFQTVISDVLVREDLEAETQFKTLWLSGNKTFHTG